MLEFHFHKAVGPQTTTQIRCFLVKFENFLRRSFLQSTSGGSVCSSDGVLISRSFTKVFVN